MQDQKKVLLYPYHANDIALVKYFPMQKEYSIGHICSSSGSGMIGKDAAYIGNLTALTGIVVEPLSDEALTDCEAVLILNGIAEEKDSMIAFIRRALLLRKEVFCYSKLFERNELEELKRLSQENGAVLHCDGLEITDPKDVKLRHLYAPYAPVLFVGGISHALDQHDILLGLTHSLQCRGISVSVLSTTLSDSFLGLQTYCIPQKLDCINFAKSFNVRIKLIEKWEHPDVILIDIPGTMSRYNDMAIGDLGIYTYILSQAVQADGCICSIFSGIFDEKFARSVSEDFQKRFNFPVNAFHISNHIMDSSSTLREGELRLLKISDEFSDRESAPYHGAEIPAYNLLNPEDMEHCCDKLISDLS